MRLQGNKDRAARAAGYTHWRDFIDCVRRTAQCEDIAVRWAGLVLTPGGDGWLVQCPFHPDATPSCHLSRSVYFCHSTHCDAKGDVIDFAQRIGNLSFEQTLFALAADYGLSCPDLGQDRTRRWHGPRKEANVPQNTPANRFRIARAEGSGDPRGWPLAEIPDDAPQPQRGRLRVIFPRVGELSDLQATSWYAYRNREGRLRAMIARRDRAGGGKDIFPLTWRTRPADNRGVWTVTGWPAGERKPVYGVERLATAKPPLSIIVVEGEKTADAAAALLGPDGWTCLAPMGGGQAASRADWSFLPACRGSTTDKIVLLLWPDADPTNPDRPGHCPAMDWADRVLEGLAAGFGSRQAMAAACLVRLVRPDPALPRGWDLADFNITRDSHSWLQAAIAGARRWNNRDLSWEGT